MMERIATGEVPTMNTVATSTPPTEGEPMVPVAVSTVHEKVETVAEHIAKAIGLIQVQRKQQPVGGWIATLVDRLVLRVAQHGIKEARGWLWKVCQNYSKQLLIKVELGIKEFIQFIMTLVESSPAMARS